MIPKLTDEIRAQLKAKYPEASLHELTSDDKRFTIVVKAPDPHVWRNFRNYTSDPSLRAGAMAKIVETTLVWPEQAQWDQCIALEPGLNEAFGAEIVTIAGANMNVSSKKL